MDSLIVNLQEPNTTQNRNKTRKLKAGLHSDGELPTLVLRADWFLVFCFVVFQFLAEYGLFQFENTQVTMGPNAAPHPPLGWMCLCLRTDRVVPTEQAAPGLDSGCGCRGLAVAAAVLYSRLGFSLQLNGFF